MRLSWRPRVAPKCSPVETAQRACRPHPTRLSSLTRHGLAVEKRPTASGNTRAILVALINICAASEWRRAYLALGPCAANERANGYATKTRGAPAGSSRKSGRLPQRHLQVLPLKLTGGGRQAQANPPVENDARTNWRRETSSSQSASGRFAKQTGAHHGGRVTAHNSPSPGAAVHLQWRAAIP